MSVSSLTSREFNQDAGRAKKAALKGPVFITDRGRPAHVLLSIEDYRKLVGGKVSLLDAIAQSDGDEIEFEPSRLRDSTFRAVDLG